jgi:small GTP-binding protein
MASHISIKFLVAGDENVGKTTIINYFTLVPVKASSTVGIDFQTRIVALSSDCENINANKDANKYANKDANKDKKDVESESETMLLSTMKVGGGTGTVRTNDYDYVKCCFWDTSGSPNYQCLAQSYYTGIAAIIVVFDLSSQQSYNNVNSYIARVVQKNNCNHSHPILVLGNKLDQRSINFTKKQVFEALCFDFPYENIRYEEVSCLDKMNTLDYGCAGCAHSSDIHVVITSFVQSLYDSVVKPHYYNPQAIAAIGCRGITGTSRFFKEQPSDKNSGVKKGWNWRGNYTDYIRDGKYKNKDNSNNNKDYIQMTSLKSPRECCNEQGLERVSSCASGCSIM